MLSVAKKHNIHITEFTVAPNIAQNEGKSYHEWFVEFENKPNDMLSFSLEVDNALREKNIYYNDLIKGNILQPLVIRSLPKNTFINYMKSIGKLGGQNKVPRLSNDRKIVEEMKFID